MNPLFWWVLGAIVLLGAAGGILALLARHSLLKRTDVYKRQMQEANTTTVKVKAMSFHSAPMVLAPAPRSIPASTWT